MAPDLQAQHDQFTLLFVQNQGRVYRYIATLVPHRADAEDLFQQTNLTIWKLWEKYDTSQAFLPWAFAIAHNHVRNYFRSEKRKSLVLSDQLTSQLAELRIQEDEHFEQLQRALAGCLRRLPASQQELVDQIYSGRETMKGAAERLQRTPDAIYKMMQRIRTALHACMQQAIAGGA